MIMNHDNSSAISYLTHITPRGSRCPEDDTGIPVKPIYLWRRIADKSASTSTSMGQQSINPDTDPIKNSLWKLTDTKFSNAKLSDANRNSYIE